MINKEKETMNKADRAFEGQTIDGRAIYVNIMRSIGRVNAYDLYIYIRGNMTKRGYSHVWTDTLEVVSEKFDRIIKKYI